MDHLAAVMVSEAAGEDPTACNHVPHDTGWPAVAALLQGRIEAHSTGFSETLAQAGRGKVKIPGVTAPKRVPACEDTPTITEQEKQIGDQMRNLGIP